MQQNYPLGIYGHCACGDTNGIMYIFGGTNYNDELNNKYIWYIDLSNNDKSFHKIKNTNYRDFVYKNEFSYNLQTIEYFDSKSLL